MYEVKMSSENTGGAEMSELSCLLPHDDGYLGLGKPRLQICSALSFHHMRCGHCQLRFGHRIILLLTDFLRVQSSVKTDYYTSPRF